MKLVRNKLEIIYTGLKIAESALLSKTPTDPKIALSAILDRRFSKPSAHKESIDSLIFMEREDFESLKKREEVMINNRLAAYIYKVRLARGLVLFVHGINSYSDDYYAIIQDYFVRNGYDVFALDLSSSGRSKGIGVTSLSDGAKDVAEAVEYIRKRRDLKNLPLYMVGHSWGAYSVAASLNYVKDIKAIACLSGFDTPLNEMISFPSKYIGVLSEITAEPLKNALKERSDKDYNLSAITGINKAKKTKVIIIQGGKDETVRPNKGSIYSCEKMIKRKHVTMFLKDKGHADIFLSPQSIEYLKKVNELKNELKKQYGPKINKIPKEALDGFISSFDKRMTSVVDESIFQKTIELFN